MGSINLHLKQKSMAENDTLRHQGMRKKLVEGLKIKGIRDEKVLEAIGKVPRHLFMESSFINFAYKDQAFPIGAGQTISQPYTVADRKSTRLNSSHVRISYAVFCLKKK